MALESHSPTPHRCTMTRGPPPPSSLAASRTPPFSHLFSKSQAVDRTSVHPLPQFPLSLNPYLETLLPEILGPQHNESTCADESRPLTQHRGLRFTVSHQSRHAAVHADRHTVPATGRSLSEGCFSPTPLRTLALPNSPAIHEVGLMGEGSKGPT